MPDYKGGNDANSANAPWCILGFRLIFDPNKVLLLGTAGETTEDGIGYNTMGLYYRIYEPIMTAMTYDATMESVTVIRGNGITSYQPIQVITTVPLGASAPNLSYTLTQSSGQGLSFDSNSASPIAIDAVANPQRIVIPDMTGVPAGTYSFTVTATDSPTSLTASYILDVVVTDPCLMSAISIAAMID